MIFSFNNLLICTCVSVKYEWSNEWNVQTLCIKRGLNGIRICDFNQIWGFVNGVKISICTSGLGGKWDTLSAYKLEITLNQVPFEQVTPEIYHYPKDSEGVWVALFLTQAPDTFIRVDLSMSVTLYFRRGLLWAWTLEITGN